MDVEINEGGEQKGITRRQMLVGTAAAGATLAWVVPAVEIATAGVASASVPPNFNSLFDYELGFTVVDPDQGNDEGYFWKFLAVIDKSGNFYLITGRGNNPPNGTSVFGTAGGTGYSIVAIDGGVPPVDGGIPIVSYNGSSNYYNSSGGTSAAAQGGYGTVSTGTSGSTLSGYGIPPGLPYSMITISPPSGYAGVSLNVTVVWDATAATFYVLCEPDEVANDVEQSGVANFPDTFIYGLDIVNDVANFSVSYTSKIANPPATSTQNDSSGSYLTYNPSPSGGSTSVQFSVGGTGSVSSPYYILYTVVV